MLLGNRSSVRGQPAGVPPVRPETLPVPTGSVEPLGHAPIIADGYPGMADLLTDRRMFVVPLIAPHVGQWYMAVFQQRG